MPWFRVDDGFHSHPKALATSLAARGLWVTAGSWSSSHLTDGVVPDQVLASLGGTPELAAELVAAGLWRRRRQSYVFHEFLSRNPSREAVENERKAAAERQRRRREAMPSRRDTAVTHAVSSPAPTRPDPTPKPKPMTAEVVNSNVEVRPEPPPNGQFDYFAADLESERRRQMDALMRQYPEVNDGPA